MHILYTDRHKLHNTDGLLIEGQPASHPEVPARAEIILSAARAASLGPVSAPTDHGLDPVLAVHDPSFVEFLRTVHARNAEYYRQAVPFAPNTFAPRSARRGPGPNYWSQAGYYAFGVGSPILEGTWQAAYWSAQCALTAADFVRQGERVVYALCRPPGHHAHADLYGGFCYLNNAAIAAHHLQSSDAEPTSADVGLNAESDAHASRLRPTSGDVGLRRKEVKVAILDVDYHHGNGTQEIFYSDASVLYCSLHAHPDDDYPYYWGGADERGEGPGVGFNRNWPLPQQADDTAFLAALDEALAAIREFGPRYLIISAGFDIAVGDPVGGFCVTTEGIREIGRRIAGLQLPTLIVQEGGYLLERLGENAVAFLSAFA
ncbi:MAG: histone deacetylase family protein [Anaerolineales bacterium]